MKKNQIIVKDNLFFCGVCDYYCERRTHWLQHIRTKKHKINTQMDDIRPNCSSTCTDVLSSLDDDPHVYSFCCVCGKQYKHKSSLCKHRKSCNEYIKQNTAYQSVSGFSRTLNQPHSIVPESIKEYVPSEKNNLCTNEVVTQNGENTNDNDVLDMMPKYIKKNQENMDKLTGLIHVLLQENKDLQTKVMEMAKEPRVQNIQNIQNNYNIINYLNTNCRDAMNLQDFIEGFDVSIKDLLELRDHGVVHSFKNTFVKQLQDMDQEKRPIHCSDKKRRKFYVKDSNEWKYDKDCDKIHSTMKLVTNKQCHALKKWKINNPDWLDNDEKQDDVAIITRNICSAYDEPERGKIVKEITALTVDKTTFLLSD